MDIVISKIIIVLERRKMWYKVEVTEWRVQGLRFVYGG
jgi:hypothetical protein